MLNPSNRFTGGCLPMITDWDYAYDNRGRVEGSLAFIEGWPVAAREFRETTGEKYRAELDVPYGDAPREQLDIFHPQGQPRGLAVFIHGGYWKTFDKSCWSHLAAGPLAAGWAVCIPSYTIAPEGRISQMTQEIMRAIEFAAGRIDGPIRLAGHSAGGHLAVRAVCEDSTLSHDTARRIERIVAISGLYDLRPLLWTAMNDVLQLDEEEARAESPALLRPLGAHPIICWVGGDELPEFIRQNDLLANIWTGLGAEIASVHMPGRHHFTVVEDLADPESDLTRKFAD
jgi:acetyl esterase/lipase